MNNELNASTAILSGSLRPWSKVNLDGEKFRQLLNQGVRAQKDNGASFFTALISAFNKTAIGIEPDIVREFSDLGKLPLKSEVIGKFIPLELPAFFNKQTEFYSYLIRNEFLGTLFYVDQTVNSMQEIDARYKILKVFKKIDSILNQVKDVKHKDRTTAFILDILKISIYFIHQELIRLYAEYIDFDVLSENELVDRIAPEISDNKDNPSVIGSFISRYKESCRSQLQEKEKVEKATEAIDSDKRVCIFEARRSDFRRTGLSPVRYDDVIDPDEFSKFEEELFNSRIIDENYNFIDTHGHLKLLAAVYHILIQKKYFREKSFNHPQKFEPWHYRQYLDTRYKVETNQQFRRCSNEEIEKYKHKYMWIDNIPKCRETVKK